MAPQQQELQELGILVTDTHILTHSHQVGCPIQVSGLLGNGDELVRVILSLLFVLGGNSLESPFPSENTSVCTSAPSRLVSGFSFFCRIACSYCFYSQPLL